MRPAVFLDRDGTVSEEVGYINHLDRFKVYPWSAAAIRKLRDAEFAVFLVTNQSGIARGYFPEDLVRQVHEVLLHSLREAGTRLDGIYYCPHHPDGREGIYRRVCNCRKPAPGLLEKAAQDHHLDLKSSFVVGDRYVDLEAGFRIGVRGILVLSGYGRGEYLYQRDTWPRSPDHIAADLGEAAEWIVSGRNTDPSLPPPPGI